MANSSAAPKQVRCQCRVRETKGSWQPQRTVVLVGLLDVRLQLGAQRRLGHILARNGSDEVLALRRAAFAAFGRLQQPPPLGRRVIALRNLQR